MEIRVEWNRCSERRLKWTWIKNNKIAHEQSDPWDIFKHSTIQKLISKPNSWNRFIDQNTFWVHSKDLAIDPPTEIKRLQQSAFRNRSYRVIVKQDQRKVPEEQGIIVKLNKNDKKQQFEKEGRFWKIDNQ